MEGWIEPDLKVSLNFVLFSQASTTGPIIAEESQEGQRLGL